MISEKSGGYSKIIGQPRMTFGWFAGSDLLGRLAIASVPLFRCVKRGVAAFSPYRISRSVARSRLSPNFFEIYVSASLDRVRSRDTKGLYSLAEQGKLNNLIGLSPNHPYEPPATPDLHLDTETQNVPQSVATLYEFITKVLNS